jgi:mRNA interferase RelE/StbE
MYNIFYTEEAKCVINSFSDKIKRQVKNAVERLAVEPSLGKKLSQELSHLWSYRMGDYRIIYKVEHNKLIIIILAIGNRKDIYKKVSKKFSI